MKKTIIALFGIGLMALYFSCGKDSTLPAYQGEQLILQITAAPTVTPVGVDGLPASITTYVAQNEAPFEIDLCFHAPNLGYEVFLEDGLCIFFDEDGHHVDHDGMHGDHDGMHGGGDAGDNFCMAGDTIDVADLPSLSLEYINTEYPGADVITLIVKPWGNLAVEISTGEVLVFGPDGDFIHECMNHETGGHGHDHDGMGSPGWHCDEPGGMGHGHNNQGGMNHHSGTDEPCWGGSGITFGDLPTAITEYVSTNHADATIEHAMQSYNHHYFLQLSDCTRLVFDENGDLLFDSGN